MEDEVIKIVVASDVSEGEAARKKLEEIGQQAQSIAPAFAQARDAQGRFVAGFGDAESAARKVAAAVGEIEAATRSAGAAGGGGIGGHPGRNHTTYASAADTYDLDLPHRKVTDAVEKEEAGFRKLIAAEHQHEAAARADGNAVNRLADEARAAGRALDTVHTGKLTGADRAGAFSRAGLLGANTLQDMIQGGPASGINNVLGAAGDKGIKALAGEFVAAAGGAGALAAALGTVAVVAGTAFLSINEGLKSQKLGWSDLGAVIDQVAGGTFSKASKQMAEDVGSVWDQIKGMVGDVAETATGWREAAQAVRAQKDEIDRATQALENYEQAQKAIAGVKSQAQQENERRGHLVGGELAELGGDKGLEGTIDRLAEHEAGADGDKKHKVKRRRKDKDGNEVETEEELTGKEIRKEAITQDFANAIGGDKASQDALKRRLKAAGLDPSGVAAAQEGVDRRKEAEDEKQSERHYAQQDAERGGPGQFAEGGSRLAEYEEKNRVADERVDDEAAKHYEKEDREQAERLAKWQAGGQDKDAIEKDRRESVAKAEKATAGTGLDSRTETATLRSMLAGGSKEQITKRVEDQLTVEFKARDSSLTDDQAREAARAKAQDAFGKVGDQIVAGASGPREQPERAKPERITTADFARSVESAGSKDQKKLVDLNTAMKERLEDLVRIGSQPARMGP